MELVGKVVRKEIEGVGLCSGTVRSRDDSSGFYEIVYDNGATEILESAEVSALVGLRGNVDLNRGPVETLGMDLNRGFDVTTGLDLNLNCLLIRWNRIGFFFLGKQYQTKILQSKTNQNYPAN